jgi:hypothetical protein
MFPPAERLNPQLIEQRPRVFQIGGIEPFCEPH